MAAYPDNTKLERARVRFTCRGRLLDPGATAQALGLVHRDFVGAEVSRAAAPAAPASGEATPAPASAAAPQKAAPSGCAATGPVGSAPAPPSGRGQVEAASVGSASTPAAEQPPSATAPAVSLTPGSAPS
eukprot:14808138-Alexandrium_andersonii.AAC.1